MKLENCFSYIKNSKHVEMTQILYAIVNSNRQQLIMDGSAIVNYR